jgi:ATP-dependent RNA helicase DDX5/DBP2
VVAGINEHPELIYHKEEKQHFKKANIWITGTSSCTMAMSEADDKAARKAKKAEMKEEAQALGISYEELKARKKKDVKKREASSLSTDEHSQDMKRMRKWSKDLTTEESVKRRTRSMDQAEEKKIESSMSPEAWRAEHSITLKGHGASANQETPVPFMQFTDAPFSQTILQTIKQAGFATPSHIQAQAWPIAVTGKDMICIAKTGSGKTCGFLLPSFHQHLQSRLGVGKSAPSRDPMMLVLAPTRELAVQIQEEAQRFGRPIGIRTLCCFGGSPKYPQIAALQRGVECVIATPGRLNDLLEMKKANLNNIKYVVLDEADRMLVSDNVDIHP